MTRIKPFKALVYNKDKIKDIASVVCPPYDVISKEKQEYFHQKHKNNLIHILLGKDTPQEDKYKKAQEYFQSWVKEAVFCQDVSPAIYFYSQRYKLRGESKIRLGFIALLRLEEGSSKVFKHEHTRHQAIEDRFKLMSAVKANLSPIFIVFPDKNRIVTRIFNQAISTQAPFIDLKDEEGTEHKVWRIDSPDVIASVQSAISHEDTFIADGHHRYEVSCAYRDMVRKKHADKLSDDEPVDYTMAYFTSANSLGLTILPIHRRVIVGPNFNTEHFITQLKEFFAVEPIKDKAQLFYLLEKAARNEHAIGACIHGAFWFMRLKNVKILDKLISDKPKVYRTLDVSVLNHLVFEKILGFASKEAERISYYHNQDELLDELAKDKTSIGFFLNPVKIEQIMSVALEGEKMPAKSTFFYPKLLSGLLINKL
ncbi:MAG: DUF1015 domain-containing protein [Candidatus Omnitrophota bacterium]|jgi:uncharacterized protein (DUF1015 family)|nr:MAG: DUF1015 domain-containing protein [Candidatus Omnitrophota bacterium]